MPSRVEKGAEEGEMARKPLPKKSVSRFRKNPPRFSVAHAPDGAAQKT